MSIGKLEEQQGNMWIAYDQMPRSREHAFSAPTHLEHGAGLPWRVCSPF